MKGVMSGMTSWQLLIVSIFVVVLQQADVVVGESCPQYTRYNGNLYYTGSNSCGNGCCGRYPDYYCCALSTAAVAGIVLGAILLICLMVFVCAYCLKKKTHPVRVVRPIHPATHTSTIVYTGMSGSYPIGQHPNPAQAMPAPPAYKRVGSPPPGYYSEARQVHVVPGPGVPEAPYGYGGPPHQYGQAVNQYGQQSTHYGPQPSGGQEQQEQQQYPSEAPPQYSYRGPGQQWSPATTAASLGAVTAPAAASVASVGPSATSAPQRQFAHRQGHSISSPSPSYTAGAAASTVPPSTAASTASSSSTVPPLSLSRHLGSRQGMAARRSSTASSHAPGTERSAALPPIADGSGGGGAECATPGGEPDRSAAAESTTNRSTITSRNFPDRLPPLPND